MRENTRPPTGVLKQGKDIEEKAVGTQTTDPQRPGGHQEWHKKRRRR